MWWIGQIHDNGDCQWSGHHSAGNLIQQQLPGDYTQTWTRNLAGQPTAMAYTQTVNNNAVPILGFSQTYDHLGRVTTATGPAGSRSYSYDDRARLTKIKDAGTEGCTTRSYSFTGDSNRTNLTSYAPDLDGPAKPRPPPPAPTTATTRPTESPQPATPTTAWDAPPPSPRPIRIKPGSAPRAT